MLSRIQERLQRGTSAYGQHVDRHQHCASSMLSHARVYARRSRSTATRRRRRCGKYDSAGGLWHLGVYCSIYTTRNQFFFKIIACYLCGETAPVLLNTLSRVVTREPRRRPSCCTVHQCTANNPEQIRFAPPPPPPPPPPPDDDGDAPVDAEHEPTPARTSTLKTSAPDCALAFSRGHSSLRWRQHAFTPAAPELTVWNSPCPCRRAPSSWLHWQKPAFATASFS
jgi:hypothetical protein